MAELQERMSSAEYTEWAAFGTLDPFGPARADLRSAMLLAMVANVNRDPKKRSRPYSPADFMLEFDPEETAEPEPPGPVDLWQKLKTWALMSGAKPKKNEGGSGGSSIAAPGGPGA